VRSALFDDAGQPVTLGFRVGKGGEGVVHRVDGHPDQVAKIYLRRPDAEHCDKLLAMTRLATPRLLRLAAWPMGTLRNGRHDELVGLLMPRVEGRPIHLLYSPKSRLDEFPETTWAFLLAAATNVSRAMAAVHEHGHVIGDVNHGNILVASDATVHLIDCDSFQVHEGERVFLCDVGVGPYVPPELQFRSLHCLRTTNHDAFGLAILVFQLLFLGRHPFSGRFFGAGDLPLERAIHEFRFAYGAGAARFQMQPPPFTPPLAVVSPQVAILFERAFARKGAEAGDRPSAADWIAALAELAKELRTCVLSPAHQYWRELPQCPWCPLELASKTRFFELLRSRVGGAGFDLELAWKQIENVAAPPLPPPLPLGIPTLPPGPEMQLYMLSVFAAAPLFYLILIATRGQAVPLQWFGAALVFGILGPWLGLYRPARALKARMETLERRVMILRLQWNQLADGEEFRQRRAQLHNHHDEYLKLNSLWSERLAELHANPAVAQRRQFLRRFPIDRARPLDIHPGLVATLRSYGIETADDLDAVSLAHVPRLPAGMDLNLLSWRYALERRFRFDPRGGTEESTAALARELEAFRHHLESDLQRGAIDLRQVAHRIEHERVVVRGRIDALVIELAKVMANRRSLFSKT
jgi:DNA-binding helix-hairpin-helix protein with protein kinase domain